MKSREISAASDHPWDENSALVFSGNKAGKNIRGASGAGGGAGWVRKGWPGEGRDTATRGMNIKNLLTFAGGDFDPAFILALGNRGSKILHDFTRHIIFHSVQRLKSDTVTDSEPGAKPI
ncbi:hypothetical protein J6590_053987 [Homalodisca vitripennis]|nr:hypothetical protein J6590_053987 [Homalodisca vitripennis]